MIIKRTIITLIVFLSLSIFFVEKSQASNEAVFKFDIFLHTAQNASDNFMKIVYSDTCLSKYNPICGIDKKTYSNKCYARVANVEFDYEGECIEGQEDCNDSQCELEGLCVDSGYMNIDKICNEGKWISNLCTESDWSYQLEPVECPPEGVQKKYWGKKKGCVGGISHLQDENVACEYKEIVSEDGIVLDMISMKKKFAQIYNRIPSIYDVIDNNAISVMLRGIEDVVVSRDLESEKKALDKFIEVFKKIPQVTGDWNIVQSIAYFEPEEMLDSDKDLVPDELEEKYNTNKFNPDSDRDGYSDGAEILNNYSPMSNFWR